MKITRRNLLRSSAVAVPSLALLDAFWWEPDRVTVTKHRIGSETGSGDKPLRFVQLTDLHLRKLSAHLESVAETVNAEKPDLVLFTGDSIDDKKNLPLLDGFLVLLDEKTLKLATLGNWEHWADVDLSKLRDTYEKHSCELLVNESKVIEHGSRKYLFTGLDDATGGYPLLKDALEGNEFSERHLLLQHTPAYFDSLRESDLSGFDPRYMLSGHTHGGQVTLFGFASILPSGSGGYVSGWYKKGGRHLYVSRGIGTVLLPARFMCPPEVAVFDWI